MKIIYSNIIPVGKFLAINLFGLLIVKKKWKKYLGPTVRNHEEIHTAQMKELWFIPFYILYFFEWLYRLVFHTKTAYRGISFEVEAYANEKNLEYLETRKHYAMWRR